MSLTSTLSHQIVFGAGRVTIQEEVTMEEIKKAAAAAVNASLKFGEAKTAFIAALVNEALRQEPSRVAAASRLGISRKHLWKLIKDMG